MTPTRPGFYWVTALDRRQPVEVVDTAWGLKASLPGIGHWRELSELSGWVGPVWEPPALEAAPTEPGFYWATFIRPTGRPPERMVVEVRHHENECKDKADRPVIVTYDIPACDEGFDPEDFSDWYGPLPDPQVTDARPATV